MDILLTFIVNCIVFWIWFQCWNWINSWTFSSFSRKIPLPLIWRFVFRSSLQSHWNVRVCAVSMHTTFERITTLNIHFTLLFSLYRQPMTLLLLLSIVRNIRHACNFLRFPFILRLSSLQIDFHSHFIRLFIENEQC